MEQVPTFISEYTARQTYYSRMFHGHLHAETLTIMNILKEKSYKAILVYPGAVGWEPQQRPQHFLREFAERGYLCFFCDTQQEPFSIDEVENNLFVLRGGDAYLLPALRSLSVIVVISWMVQMAWADLLPHKVIWYDLLDQLEFFSLYDEQMHRKHDDVVKHAALVTYSAEPLKTYVAERANAMYIPNAVHVKDFQTSTSSTEIPVELRPLIEQGKPIIGYFGAIEDWFHIDLVRTIAIRRPDWQFICIGKNGREDRDQLSLPDNVHLLGAKKYSELAAYGRYFQVAIIPFILNDITKHVSPLKFYEYSALGIPIVSTPLPEVLPYASSWVQIASHVDEFERAILLSFHPAIAMQAKYSGAQLALTHSWSSRVDQIEHVWKQDWMFWKIYGNYSSAHKVAVMTVTFLDYEGNNFYNGGAERYLVDLSELCKQLGIQMTIYQYGNYTWIRKFGEIDVVSLSRGGQQTYPFSIPTVTTFNRLFQEQTANQSAVNIYSAYFNAWPYANNKNSIGIIHGISWDQPGSSYKDGVTFWETNRRFIEGATLCHQLVSVDTNSPNWFQTIDYAVGQKMTVIPNYVDTDVFTPRDNHLDLRDKVVILYPRRLYQARGLYMVLELMDGVLEQYPQVEFHFVGKGSNEDTQHVTRKIGQWPGRVKWYSLPLEEMSHAYKQADITLIPTLYSEGTSLSCLEAMACGNAVIATRVGGLTDLVLNNYNGLLIEPSGDALREAICSLLDHPEVMTAFKEKSRSVAASFSKERWRKHWLSLLQANLSVQGQSVLVPTPQTSTKLIEIYVEQSPLPNSLLGQFITDHLINGDLVYLRMKQFAGRYTYSFGRLQWMNWEDEHYAKPDIIVAEQSIHDDVPVQIHAIWTPRGELSWISSSQV
ncbi:glycosyltransferase [Paenibacillus sp. N1-5-1-14]|uniref:glycosyltransferase n=1 Tax=Paenibacillus radicibacter TaxID=2972488 RepID=UPI0021595A2D|nr:glycosyltransferase [Paenibacillus radicibacter]MCR8644685.1 glycosyltransferase [Paenibacillus radicibacter]